LESKGGFVETSGDHLKTDGITVKAKEWLLDPSDITISNSASSNVTGTSPADITPNAGAGTSSIVQVSTIQSAINAGTNVTIKTTNAANTTGAGNITIANALAFANNSDTNATLSLMADNGITQNAGASITTSAVAGKTGLVNINMTANGNFQGNTAASTSSQGITLNAGISTNGNVTLTGTNKNTNGNSRGVTFANGSSITANTITVTGTATGAAESNQGVFFTGTSSIKATGTGSSVISGISSSTAGAINSAVVFNDGSNVTLDGGTGGLTVQGTHTVGGYGGIRFGAYGVSSANPSLTTRGNVTLGTQDANNASLNAAFMVRGGSITSDAGSNLTIRGQSTGTGINFHDGLGTIRSNGGSITLNGVATSSGHGVLLNSNQVGTLNSGGNVTITGTSSGNGNSGVNFNGGNVRVFGNNVTINGTANTTSGQTSYGFRSVIGPGAGNTITAAGNLSITGAVNGAGTGTAVFHTSTSWQNLVNAYTTGGTLSITGTNNAAASNTSATITMAGVQARAGGHLTVSATTNNAATDAISIFSNSYLSGGVAPGYQGGASSFVSTGGNTTIQSNQGSILIQDGVPNSVTSTAITGQNVIIDNTGGTFTGGVFTAGNGTSTRADRAGVQITDSLSGNDLHLASNTTRRTITASDASGQIVLSGKSTSSSASSQGVRIGSTVSFVAPTTSVLGTSTASNGVFTSAAISTANNLGITGISSSQVNQQGGVVLQGAVTTGSTGQVNINATNLNGGSNWAFYQVAGANINAGTGGVSITAMGSGANSALDIYGKITTTGAVNLTGNAGIGGGNGIWTSGTVDISGTSVTMNGTGGSTGGVGAFLSSGTTVTATTGDVSITGIRPTSTTTAAINISGTVNGVATRNIHLIGGLTGGGSIVTNGAAVMLNNSMTAVDSFSGVISGTGSLNNQTGRQGLTGANTYTGTTTISAGTLQIGNGGTTGSLGTNTGDITNNGTLAFNRSNALTVANAIIGTGALTQSGTGTTTLTGTNTYTGTTAINAGILQVGSGGSTGTLGAGNVTLANGAGLAYNRNVNTVVDNVISGNGSVSATITGNLDVAKTVNLNTTGNTVNLSASGNITQSAGSITATNLYLTATTGSIGSSSNRINSNVSNLALTSAGDQFVTQQGAVNLAARTTGTGNIDARTTNGTMRVTSVNSVNGVTAAGTAGSITLEGNTTTGHGVNINQVITANNGNVSLTGSTATTTGGQAGIFSTGAVSGRNITMLATATALTGNVLGYFGAGGTFNASEVLTLTGQSVNANGLYSYQGGYQSGTGMVLVGSSVNGSGVGVDNDVIVTNTGAGGITITGTASTTHDAIGMRGVAITSSAGEVVLKAVTGNIVTTVGNPGAWGGVNRTNTITNNGSGKVEITAGNGSATNTGLINGTVFAITQNANADVVVRTSGTGNVTSPKVVNNGTGNVTVAAGSNLAAGTSSGGQVLTVGGNDIRQNNGGTTYVYSGEASTTGQLSDLSAAFNQLVYQGSGLSQNSRFNTAFGGNTIAGASAQVLFRETTAPSFTLALNNISKTYGDADPALADRNTALLNAYIGPSTLTTAVSGANGGSNTFAVAAADVINGLTGTSRAAGSNMGSYAYTNVSASAFNTTLSAQPNLVINRRDITLSGVIAATKFYDGNTSAGITGGTFNNIVAGETLALSGTGYFNSPNVNGVSTVTVDDVATLTQAVGGTGAWSNYNLLPAAGAITSSTSGKITPVALTARVNDSAVFVTQSASSAPDMGVMYTGFVNGESASTALSGLGVRTYSGAADYPVAGSYTHVYGLSATPSANHGNYTVTVEQGALTVVPADKLLIRVDSQNSAYGQQTAAADGVAGLGTVGAYYCLDASAACNGANLVRLNLTRLSPNRWKAADSTGSFVVFDTSISGASYSTGGYLNVGNYQYAASEISPLSLPNGNFTGRFSNAGVLTVDAQPITATYLASDKRVDGTASAQVVSTTSGFFADDLVADQWVSASFDTASVGNRKTVSINGVQLQGADRANYRLINPLALTTANILPVDVPQESKPAKPQVKPVVHWYELGNNAAEKRVIRSDVVLPAGAAVASEEGPGSAGAADNSAGGHLGGLASRSKPIDDMAACVSDVVTPMMQEAPSSCVCKPTPIEGIQVCTEPRPAGAVLSRAL
jgi:hypothetical protein